MKVYILMDTNEYTGGGSIIGVYKDETKAKLELAEYVLERKSVGFDYIDLVTHEVKE